MTLIQIFLGVLNGFFEGNREREGDAGELNGETGTTCDVEIGELTEGVLEFKDADEFGVEGEDAGAASLGNGRCQTRVGRDGRRLTEDPNAYV